MQPPAPLSMVSPARPPLPESVRRGRVVVIIRGDYDHTHMPALAEILRETGLLAVEVTANSPNAADCIAALSAEPGLEVGAGTVLDLETAHRLRSVGARFLVTPNVDPALIRAAADDGVPVMPGAFTPTEVIRAWQAGAAAVKLFPADVLGPKFVSALQGPVPDIPLIPTGGISDSTAPAFLDAGAVAVAVATWLLPRRASDLNLDQVRRRARALSRAVANSTHAEGD